MADQPPGRLLSILGLGFGLAGAVGGTIGAGILRTPGLVAAQLPSTALVLAVWLAAVVGGELLSAAVEDPCQLVSDGLLSRLEGGYEDAGEEQARQWGRSRGGGAEGGVAAPSETPPFPPFLPCPARPNPRLGSGALVQPAAA